MVQARLNDTVGVERRARCGIHGDSPNCGLADHTHYGGRFWARTPAAAGVIWCRFAIRHCRDNCWEYRSGRSLRMVLLAQKLSRSNGRSLFR